LSNDEEFEAMNKKERRKSWRRPRARASSTVITPSLPTFFVAPSMRVGHDHAGVDREKLRRPQGRATPG
jgi:hypothetical protein